MRHTEWNAPSASKVSAMTHEETLRTTCPLNELWCLMLWKTAHIHVIHTYGQVILSKWLWFKNPRAGHCRSTACVCTCCLCLCMRDRKRCKNRIKIHLDGDTLFSCNYPKSLFLWLGTTLKQTCAHTNVHKQSLVLSTNISHSPLHTTRKGICVMASLSRCVLLCLYELFIC